MTKIYKNKCYGYERCFQIIGSTLPPDHSGSVSLGDVMCYGCMGKMFELQEWTL